MENKWCKCHRLRIRHQVTTYWMHIQNIFQYSYRVWANISASQVHYLEGKDDWLIPFSIFLCIVQEVIYKFNKRINGRNVQRTIPSWNISHQINNCTENSCRVYFYSSPTYSSLQERDDECWAKQWSCRVVNRDSIVSMDWHYTEVTTIYYKVKVRTIIIIWWK